MHYVQSLPAERGTGAQQPARTERRPQAPQASNVEAPVLFALKLLL